MRCLCRYHYLHGDQYVDAMTYCSERILLEAVFYSV